MSFEFTPRTLTLLLTPALVMLSVTADLRAQQSGGIAPLRVGGNIQAPRKIKDARPVYPPDAREARVQGVVILEIIVDVDGTVKDPVVLRSIPLLDQAALDTVRQWQYEPVMLNGVAVPVKMTVTVNFTLGPDGLPAPARTITGGVSGGLVGGAVGGVVSVGGGPTILTSTLPAPTDRVLFRSGRGDGTVDVYELGEERAAKLPRWDQSSSPEPPLSAGSAISIARGWLQQQNPQQDRFDLLEVALSAHFFPQADRAAYAIWLYRIRLRPVLQPTPSSARFGMPLMVIVALDGSVVEPRNEPRAR
jgi:TonB family protein